MNTPDMETTVTPTDATLQETEPAVTPNDTASQEAADTAVTATTAQEQPACYAQPHEMPPYQPSNQQPPMYTHAAPYAAPPIQAPYAQQQPIYRPTMAQEPMYAPQGYAYSVPQQPMPQQPTPPLPVDVEDRVDKSFSKALAAVAMAQFPIVCVIALIFSIIAHKTLNEANQLAKYYGIRQLGGKAIAARIMSAVGLGMSIYTTVNLVLVGAYFVLYFFIMFMALAVGA